MEVTFTGPLFDGRAEKIVDDMAIDISKDLATEAYRRVRTRLKSVLKHPTGYYESRVTTDNTSNGAVISDGGVIYGPWLEGEGSRNKSTRFKGYHTFRLVAQSLNKDADEIADKSIKRDIARLQ
jgi:hypothetical protein